MNRLMISITAGVLLFAGSTLASAEDMGGGPGPGNRKPPAEAIEACKDKNEGETVQITTPRGETLKATCTQIDGQLVAVPQGVRIPGKN